MKRIITNYGTFVPASRTLDFSAVRGFDIRQLLTVVNLTAKQDIYVAGSTGFGFSAVSASNVVTFDYNTSSMSADDRLLILYEDDAGGIIQLLSAASYTGDDTFVSGGLYAWDIYGSWDGAISQLAVSPDRLYWFDLNEFIATGDDGFDNVSIPEGWVRVGLDAVGAETSLTSTLRRISR